MCAMATSKSPRKNRSIIKPVNRIESSGSDYHSDNDLDQHISTSHIDASTQTAAACCPHGFPDPQICRHSDDLSSKQIYKRSTSLGCLSPSTIPSDNHYRHQPFYSPSPNLSRETKKENQIPIGIRRSISVNDLLLSPLSEKLTGDSGKGESMVNLLLTTSTNPIHYEVVPIYGLQGTALMANRFDFDQSKIDEHQHSKQKKPALPSYSSAPILQSTSKNTKRTGTMNPSTKKSPGFIRYFLRKTFKSVGTNQTFNQPMIMHRHHMPQSEENDNQ